MKRQVLLFMLIALPLLLMAQTEKNICRAIYKSSGKRSTIISREIESDSLVIERLGHMNRYQRRMYLDSFVSYTSSIDTMIIKNNGIFYPIDGQLKEYLTIDGFNKRKQIYHYKIVKRQYEYDTSIFVSTYRYKPLFDTVMFNEKCFVYESQFYLIEHLEHLDYEYIDSLFKTQDPNHVFDDGTCYGGTTSHLIFIPSRLFLIHRDLDAYRYGDYDKLELIYLEDECCKDRTILKW